MLAEGIEAGLNAVARDDGGDRRLRACVVGGAVVGGGDRNVVGV